MRSALRYYGGKQRLAPWIASFFPPHVCYVEPFGGAASVLLHKAPARFEVYNDLDGEVVGFFRVLREQPTEFRRLVELTPYSRAEVKLACSGEEVADDLERARRLYVRAWQSIHGAPARGQMGWRYERANGRGWSRTVVDFFNATEHLLDIAARLKGVQLECDDAFTVIQRFDTPDTLFYVDPPYPASTRDDRWRRCAYKHELDDAAHERLAAALHAVQGMVVVSGYPCPLYDRLYTEQGWHRAVRVSGTQSRTGRVATEALWCSPRARDGTVWQTAALPLGLDGLDGGDGAAAQAQAQHQDQEAATR